MTAPAAPPSDASTQLSVVRTRLSYERTMMSWVRTGTSLISFGFTIYKFFQFQVEHGVAPQTSRVFGPREFAMLMIATGLVALLLSAVEHHHAMKIMRATYGPQPASVARVVAVFVGVLGLIAFLVTLLGG